MKKYCLNCANNYLLNEREKKNKKNNSKNFFFQVKWLAECTFCFWGYSNSKLLKNSKFYGHIRRTGLAGIMMSLSTKNVQSDIFVKKCRHI